MQTPEQYYSDDGNYGSYQYFKLSELIDDLQLESMDDDSLLKNTKRSKMVNAAFRGVRELSRNVSNDVLGFEFTVPDTLVFPLPYDYVNWVRISLVVNDEVTGSNRLVPLDINYKIHTAIGYLQDNKGDILFDSDGRILTADSSNAIAKPYKTYTFSGCDGQFTTDASKFSRYGEFSIDERRGIIVFSSDLADREVVFEYVSDGLQAKLSEDEITIHKHLREALYDFVVYECIATKRNVSRGDKMDLKNKWLSSRHRAVMARADFDLYRISRTLRNSSMTL